MSSLFELFTFGLSALLAFSPNPYCPSVLFALSLSFELSAILTFSLQH
jgi:hypothetical protein